MNETYVPQYIYSIHTAFALEEKNCQFSFLSNPEKGNSLNKSATELRLVSFDAEFKSMVFKTGHNRIHTVMPCHENHIPYTGIPQTVYRWGNLFHGN